MTTAYTSLLGLALPVTGELSGTWGDTVNNYITSYVDAAVAGAQTISGSQTAVTLSTTNGGSLTSAGSGSTGSAQYAIINCTGNPGGLLTITAPATSKVYLILNNTSTAQSVKIVGTGPTTGVTVATAQNALVAWNGTDFELVATIDASKLTGILATANGGTGLSTFTAANNALYSTSSSVLTAGTLPVAAGGTGLATLTANNVILGNGTSTVQFVAPGTSGNVLSSNGTTWASAAPSTSVILTNARETATVSATAATGTINYDISTQSVLYYTTNASANWTVNFRGSSGTSLNTLMSTGQSMTVAFLVTQGSTAYYNSAVQVDGSAVTPKWQGGLAPSAGNASGVDSYVYTIVKTASATFTVFASLTQFA